MGGSNEEERWDFGATEWCQFAGELGVRLIEEANLDLSKYEWGFSEIYTHAPDRVLAGRDQSSYHFMIAGGKVSGGDGVPEECLALPGFHISAPWAAIAEASSYIYGREGQRLRSAEEAIMWAELAKTDPIMKKESKPAEKKEPRCVVCGSPDHERPDCPVWPPGIGESLSVDGEKGGGLHNLTAKRLKHSPELADLPKSDWGVPLIVEMTNEQREYFYKLLGR